MPRPRTIQRKIDGWVEAAVAIHIGKKQVTITGTIDDHTAADGPRSRLEASPLEIVNQALRHLYRCEAVAWGEQQACREETGAEDQGNE